MQKTGGKTNQLAVLLMASLLGGCATTTHWIDTTGQSRPDWQFQRNFSTCHQLGVATEQQYEDRLRPSVANARNEQQATFIFIAAEADALVAGESQFKMCMASSGWVKRKIESTPSRSIAFNEVRNSHPKSSATTEPQASNSQPVASLQESAPQDGIITVKDIHIAPKEWREYPAGKASDTLTFIDNHISVYSNGSIFVNVMMNYDRPSKLLFIGMTQSVLFNVAFRCDSNKGVARQIDFYSGRDATGTLLKKAQNTSIHIKPNSVENQMQNYVCSAIASR